MCHKSLLIHHLAAVDQENVPVMIPRIIPQTKTEVVLHEGGHERRLRRLHQRQELINLVKSSSSRS